jgi:hypothetical protein
MNDDTTTTDLDRKLISLQQPYEVRDWCKSFGCSKEELQNAVKAVGRSAADVREYLNSRTARRSA